MATPQGNFTAYQQLKPTELKVGDIYNKAIDELIKNNQAQQAAALKQKMQQNQSLDKLIYDIGDSFKGGIKTTSAMASFASDYTKQTGDRYGQLMYNASLTTDPAEKQRYLQEALRLKNGYEALKASMQSMDYDNVANNDNKNLTDGKVWAGDDKIYVRTLFGNGALKPTIGEDGNYYVAVPKGANAKPDDPAEMVPINDFFSRYYGKGLEVDITQNFLDDVAKDGRNARDSRLYETRKDRSGQLHSVRALSDKDRNGILDKYFNMKENDFDVSKVNRGIYQLFYNKYGKYMENFDDYKTIRGVVDEYVKAAVPIDTKDKQVSNTVVNVRNYTSSGDKATQQALNRIGSMYIYSNDKNGNVFGHKAIVIPTTKGRNGKPNNNVAVLRNTKTGEISFKEIVRNKSGQNIISTKDVDESTAITLIRQNVSGNIDPYAVLDGMINRATRLNSNKKYFNNIDMTPMETKSGGGLLGK